MFASVLAIVTPALDRFRSKTEKLTASRLAQSRLAAIVESTDEAIVSKNLDGIIMSWNSGAEQLFGYTASEAIGKSILIIIPEDRRSEEWQILERIGRGERIKHYETVRRRKDGTLLDISLTISPIMDAGRVIGASKLARDITARKRADEELRKAREELAQANEKLARANEELEARVEQRTASLSEAVAQMEEFSYSVSHDLRAPARAMQGYAQAMLEDFGSQLEGQASEYLHRIVRSANRMDRLVRDLLVYSRVARSEIPLQSVSLDLLVRDIVQQYPEMQAPRAEVIVQDGLPHVLAHEPSLFQAISNLLNNAVKFVAPGVQPRVEVYSESRNENRVRLWVHDNGIGIKPEHQGRLFGLFERIHPDERYEGTGMGLAIVRKAVERMGGKVGMESNGGGSKFWLELQGTSGIDD